MSILELQEGFKTYMGDRDKPDGDTDDTLLGWKLGRAFFMVSSADGSYEYERDVIRFDKLADEVNERYPSLVRKVRDWNRAEHNWGLVFTQLPAWASE